MIILDFDKSTSLPFGKNSLDSSSCCWQQWTSLFRVLSQVLISQITQVTPQGYVSELSLFLHLYPVTCGMKATNQSYHENGRNVRASINILLSVKVSRWYPETHPSRIYKGMDILPYFQVRIRFARSTQRKHSIFSRRLNDYPRRWSSSWIGCKVCKTKFLFSFRGEKGSSLLYCLQLFRGQYSKIFSAYLSLLFWIKSHLFCFLV